MHNYMYILQVVVYIIIMHPSIHSCLGYMYLKLKQSNVMYELQVYCIFDNTKKKIELCIEKCILIAYKYVKVAVQLMVFRNNIIVYKDHSVQEWVLILKLAAFGAWILCCLFSLVKESGKIHATPMLVFN